MTDILKSDVFFVVATIAVVAVTICVVVALVYLIKILKNAQKLSERAREEGEAIIRGVGSVRSGIVGFISRSFINKKKKTKNESRES